MAEALESLETYVAPAQTELSTLASEFSRQLPYFASGVLLFLLFLILSVVASKLSRWLAKYFIDNSLIISVIAKLSGIIVCLLGVYLGLKVSGLTKLATTILGGTGLAGLVFGFAFRDIAENFLASILLSVHRPFRIGDVVEIEGVIGIVERMTMRCTVLMNFNGDHVQIPNGTVFKAKIRNVTANPNQRGTFRVGVGFDAPLSEVQSIVYEVLESHPAVLKEPRPNVLVDELGSATVNLNVFYWVNIKENDGLKTRSSVIRLSKLALESAGISMPDEAREIIFPDGVPVVMTSDDDRSAHQELETSKNLSERALAEPTSSEAEGDFSSEHDALKKQLVQSSTPESGQNILE